LKTGPLQKQLVTVVAEFLTSIFFDVKRWEKLESFSFDYHILETDIEGFESKKISKRDSAVCSKLGSFATIALSSSTSD
jgi:hypothetical protein